ncbi:glycosyltransferase family 4 protein [Jatrophihabitans cynanchi]|uniref:Glycosyltransferase family 4 protein n=1 Tax=Jatrophihabitans cynanchi TaxID=2944128 RepID=A0ABY7JZH6_9ACTN|nr:glycosyltransferase family 4 protein [Jatrophihabitans sp. SB3-54]WAX57986.1 glycosyltransferase family 4 protein [Jatrophihabitans sp. SB3-54]
MISFVWSPGNVLPAGTGGSENYTTGQVRELNGRGVPARVVTVGLGHADGRDQFTDVPFLSVAQLSDVSRLTDTVVFVNDIAHVPTIKPSFQILHNPPPIREKYRALAIESVRDRVLIATSRYSARLWSEYLRVDSASVHVVYPFAESPFALADRHDAPRGSTRILYAGRLSPEKGIYTLLSMLHVDVIADDPLLTFTVTTAGADKPQGKVIEQLVAAHPGLGVAPARKSPASMSSLMAEHDIVVMPSNGQYWHETFGIVAIEAQHTGCWVVASDDGGLPETDCGGVILIEPDNAEALAWGIRDAVARGPMSAALRSTATGRFTVGQSVDALLELLSRHGHRSAPHLERELEAIIRLPSPPLRLPAPRGVRAETPAPA